MRPTDHAAAGEPLRLGRRPFLGLLALAPGGLLLGGCQASCTEKSGADAQACQARMSEQAKVRAESRPYGR